jgi:hypothetical protein
MIHFQYCHQAVLSFFVYIMSLSSTLISIVLFKIEILFDCLQICGIMMQFLTNITFILLINKYMITVL